MKRNILLLGCCLISLWLMAAPAMAEDFAGSVDLTPLETIAVQHNETMKTLDTLAREAIWQITDSSSIDGHPALYTLLDMSFKPKDYTSRNMIKIRNLPLRKEFFLLDSIDDAEKNRILKEGTVSLEFLKRQDVLMILENAEAQSVAKTKAINDLMMGRGFMQEVCELDHPFLSAAIVPPATNAANDHIWHRVSEMTVNDPSLIAMFKAHGREAPKPLDNYENRALLIDQLMTSSVNLYDGWVKGDAAKVNISAKALADVLPRINPDVYPSMARRKAEVIYNHLMKLTIPGAAFYFIAMVLFLMSANSGFVAMRLWALRFMAIGLLVHTTGIAIRWWLVGGGFPPIKNEFESVMFSAWFGVVVGMVLELRRSRGIFGAAASFIGTLSLVAIFAAPFVADRQIGGDIAQVQGILMSYWLYIHVTMVTASYAMIGMGFMLSSWWLIRYYKDYGTLRRVPGNLLAGKGSDADLPSASRARQGGEDEIPMPIAGGAIALGFTQTLGMMLFMPRPKTITVAKADARVSAKAIENSRVRFLSQLDQCNLVVLQLAFWLLGAGIICGAIWADQSWGRPWNWDPKETFALVTLIAYMIIVHVRVVTENKAWWTAVLGCLGFFIMLFNWIGVNFLLVGLHSYA